MYKREITCIEKTENFLYLQERNFNFRQINDYRLGNSYNSKLKYCSLKACPTNLHLQIFESKKAL